jgi:hypothetical protein
MIEKWISTTARLETHSTSYIHSRWFKQTLISCNAEIQLFVAGGGQDVLFV